MRSNSNHPKLDGMNQRTYSSYSNTGYNDEFDRDQEEIDLMEILQEIPDDHFENAPHPSPRDEEQSSGNTFLLILKGIFAFIFAGLQTLPVSTRYIHKLLILHFIFTSVGLNSYLEFNCLKISDNYQYWRMVTCFLSDSSVFLALLGCITLGDLMKRMEYQFGSLWTLYLLLTQCLLLPLLTLLCQWLILSNSPNTPSFITNRGCIGVYPLIFSLLVIESLLSLPNAIYPVFGIVYVASKYHPVIYALSYSVLFRFDLTVFIGIIVNAVIIQCIPFVFHLTRYRVQKMERSKCMDCMRRDVLFVPIEQIDFDCHIATRKIVSAQSNRNAPFSPHLSDDINNLQHVQNIAMQMNGHSGHSGNDEVDSPDDREDLPFIHGHPLPYPDSGDMEQQTTTSSRDRNRHISKASVTKTMLSMQQRLQSHVHTNLPVNRKRG